MATDGHGLTTDSLAGDLTSDWRLRPINLFSVLKSFVYQLRPGQDLNLEVDLLARYVERCMKGSGAESNR